VKRAKTRDLSWSRLRLLQIGETLYAFNSHSILQTNAREERVYQRYLAFSSLQLMTSLAVGRTIANVNPPVAAPQITGVDT